MLVGAEQTVLGKQNDSREMMQHKKQYESRYDYIFNNNRKNKINEFITIDHCNIM